MRFKYFLIILLCTYITFSCRKANKKSTEPSPVTNLIKKESSPKSDAQNNINDKVLKEILKKQLERGKSALYNNSFDVITYRFSSKDLEVTLPVLKEMLIGYTAPSNEEFKTKVEEIFGRIIDYKIESKYLYVNLKDNTDKKMKFYRNDNSIEINPFGMFIIKEDNFITPLYALPEILNYKEKYPEIYDFEKTMSTNSRNDDGESIKLNKWMDDKSNNLIKTTKTFVARNRYLFNDDKSQLNWLLLNDEEFMELLIRTYDYSKDQKHRIWFEKRN